MGWLTCAENACMCVNHRAVPFFFFGRRRRRLFPGVARDHTPAATGSFLAPLFTPPTSVHPWPPLPAPAQSPHCTSLSLLTARPSRSTAHRAAPSPPAFESLDSCVCSANREPPFELPGIARRRVG
jgi:hypothetical protein